MNFKTTFAALAASLTLMATSASALTVYSSVDEENARKLLAAFTKATGVDVQMVHLSSGPALSRIEAEKGNPQADVWFGAPSENHVVAHERGLTQAYVSANADGLRDEFKNAEGFWHGIYTNPMAVGVRTDLLEQRGAPVPTSWEELLNPAYKGLIQMPSPQSSGTAYGLILQLIAQRGEDEAFKYLKDLAPNIQTYTQSGTAPAGALGLGESPIAIQFSPGILKLADEGYPVDVIFPSEGVGYEVAAVSILEGASDVENAKKLVDWILSEEGQNALSENKTYFMPVRAGISAGEGVPSIDAVTLVPSDAAFSSANRQRLIDRWASEVLGQ